MLESAQSNQDAVRQNPRSLPNLRLTVWPPAWCEFFVRISPMASIGIPAASLVIARRLCKIANGTTVRTTHQDRQRALMIDLAIWLTPPLSTLVICASGYSAQLPQCSLTFPLRLLHSRPPIRYLRGCWVLSSSPIHYPLFLPLLRLADFHWSYLSCLLR